MNVVTHMYDQSKKPVRTKNDRVRVQTIIPEGPDEKRTKNEFLKETDINAIMAKYKKTGILPESVRAEAAKYGDFSQVPDFIEMQNKIIAANNLFDALPATVRRQFDNDPGQFIQAAQTKEGRELMVKLGLGAPERPLGDAVGVSLGEASQPTPKVSPEVKGEPKKEKSSSESTK